MIKSIFQRATLLAISLGLLLLFCVACDSLLFSRDPETGETRGAWSGDETDGDPDNKDRANEWLAILEAGLYASGIGAPAAGAVWLARKRMKQGQKKKRVERVEDVKAVVDEFKVGLGEIVKETLEEHKKELTNGADNPS